MSTSFDKSIFAPKPRRALIFTDPKNLQSIMHLCQSNADFFCRHNGPKSLPGYVLPCQSKHSSSEYQHSLLSVCLCQQQITLYFSYSILFLSTSMQSFWWSEGVIVVHSSSQTRIHVVFYLITGITYKNVLPFKLRSHYQQNLIARGKLGSYIERNKLSTRSAELS